MSQITMLPSVATRAAALYRAACRRRRLLAGAFAAALLLAACGSSPGPTGAGAKGAPAKGSPIAFSRCMRANGVPNFPDPQGGGIRIQASRTAGSGQSLRVNGVPVNAPAFQAAQAKCSKYAPVGGKPSAQELAKLRAGALAMARCMRTHGVPHFPDPVVSTGPGGLGIGVKTRAGSVGMDPSSPAFQAAQKLCQPLMGGVGRSTTGGTAPSAAG